MCKDKLLELAEWERLTWADSTGREISVRSDRSGLTANEFVDELVRCLMLGCTYHPHSVDEALGQNEFGDRDAKET